MSIRLFRTVLFEPEGHTSLGEVLRSSAYMARLEVAVA
jgi:hypothetical protein